MLVDGAEFVDGGFEGVEGGGAVTEAAEEWFLVLVEESLLLLLLILKFNGHVVIVLFRWSTTGSSSGIVSGGSVYMQDIRSSASQIRILGGWLSHSGTGWCLGLRLDDGRS